MINLQLKPTYIQHLCDLTQNKRLKQMIKADDEHTNFTKPFRVREGSPVGISSGGARPGPDGTHAPAEKGCAPTDEMDQN